MATVNDVGSIGAVLLVFAAVLGLIAWRRRLVALVGISLLGVAGIPSISESTMIARDAAIAGYEEGRIHIQHLSARESIEAIAAAKAQGVRITCEASPHHLLLTHDDVRSLDTLYYIYLIYYIIIYLTYIFNFQYYRNIVSLCMGVQDRNIMVYI